MAKRFTSKTQAMNLRIKVWTCRRCRAQHRFKSKPARCQRCDTLGEFFYFASAAEANRFSTLALMQDHGIISNLQTQANYPLKVNGVLIATYRADFVYTTADGRQIIEDVKPKGFTTDVFKLKKKLMRACYGVDVLCFES